MKYILNYEKNDEKKTINEKWISYGNEIVERILGISKERFKRNISLKQISPIRMNDILKYFHEGKSISQISRIVGFSRKAIKENIKKSIDKKVMQKTIKKGKFKIKYFRKIIYYSLEKWIANWCANSHRKKETWHAIVENNFECFLNWWNQNKNNKQIFPIKISADFLIYQYCKGIKPSRIPTRQTIYNWAREKKFNFDRKYFIKLFYGLYYKKPCIVRKNRIYNDFSKPITMLKQDMIGKSYKNAYEIDLVKGKKNDNYSILTCLNKETRMLYAKITKPDAVSVKSNLIKIINENKLVIDQLIIDNGSENVLLHNIKSIKQIYRCRPYCSSDKGQIENVHRLLRYWIKKGSSIDLLTQEKLNEVVEHINNYPRKTYNPKKLMSAIEYAKWCN